MYDVCEICNGNEEDIDNCICIQYDCNGDCPPIEDCPEEFSFIEGCAIRDECNQCVGGATERYPCEQDCIGEWGGSAYEDNCNQCIADINDIDCFYSSFNVYNSNGNIIGNDIIPESDTRFYVALHMQNLPDYLEGIIVNLGIDASILSLNDWSINPNDWDIEVDLTGELGSAYILQGAFIDTTFRAAIVLATNEFYQGNNGNILFLQFSNLGINGDSTVISYNTVQVNEHVMQEQNYTSQVIYFGDCYGVFNGETPLDECGVCGGDNSSCSGCTDIDALNYDDEAIVDDGSCFYCDLGDVDCDGEINVLDIVLAANMVLADEYDVIADINEDGNLNVLDVVILVNLILDGDDGACIDIDGNVYETVQIGEQLWMAENLKVTHYNDGSDIPNITYNQDWYGLSTGAYGDYDNNPTNSETYGRLYNWYTVNDDRGVCPDGFHVPSDEEFMGLEMYLGMSEEDANSTGIRGTDEGSKLAGNSDLWVDNALQQNTIIDSHSEFGTSGFTALPAGYRHMSGGSYNTMGQYGNFWLSSESGLFDAWRRQLGYTHSSTFRNDYDKHFGISIRCLGD